MFEKREDLIKFIDQSRCGAMTISDIGLIRNAVLVVMGHHGDKVTKVYVDNIYIGKLYDFVKDITEKDSEYVIFRNKPLCKDYTFGYPKSVKFYTIKRGM